MVYSRDKILRFFSPIFFLVIFFNPAYYAQYFAGSFNISLKPYSKNQPIMLLFLLITLCFGALKIYLLCSRTRILVRLVCYLCTSLQKQFITCSRQLFESMFYWSAFANINKVDHAYCSSIIQLLCY